MIKLNFKLLMLIFLISYNKIKLMKRKNKKFFSENVIFINNYRVKIIGQ
jgi:hypothetical protein